MLTILGTAIQNAVVWPNRRPKFVTCEVGITLLVVVPKLCMAMYSEPWNFRDRNIVVQWKTTW